MSRFGLLGLSLILTGCHLATPPIAGSGAVTTGTREIADFTQVEFAIPVNLQIRKGPVASLELTIDDNLAAHVQTAVAGQVLRVSSAENLAPSRNSQVILVVPVVSRVAIIGASRVSIEELSGAEASLSIAGSGDVTAAVQSPKLKCEIAGSGTIRVSGSAQTVEISIAGAGDVSTNEIAADTVSIDIAGSGTVHTHASKSLDVSIAGSGDVTYSGQPQIDQSIAGSGTIKASSNPPPQTAEKAEQL